MAEKTHHWPLSFTEACSLVFQVPNGDAYPDETVQYYYMAEATILNHTPTSLAEVERILKMLLRDGGTERTDGADIDALINIRAFVRSLLSTEANPDGSHRSHDDAVAGPMERR